MVLDCCGIHTWGRGLLVSGRQGRSTEYLARIETLLLARQAGSPPRPPGVFFCFQDDVLTSFTVDPEPLLQSCLRISFFSTRLFMCAFLLLVLADAFDWGPALLGALAQHAKLGKTCLAENCSREGTWLGLSLGALSGRPRPTWHWRTGLNASCASLQRVPTWTCLESDRSS